MAEKTEAAILARYLKSKDERLHQIIAFTEKLPATTIVPVLDRAIQVFGDPEGACDWLTNPSVSLGGEIPLLQLPRKQEQILQMLGMIECGSF